MRTDLIAPEQIAMTYGGDKRKIAAAVQAGVLDPTSGVLAGMFIDRMRNAAIEEQAPHTTVAQDVMAAAPAALGATPQAAQLAQGQERAMQAVPPSDAGVAALPVDERLIPGGEGYAGGGIVAFANGDLVEGRGYFTPTPSLSRYVEKKETGGYKGDPNKAVSPKGARGRMQIMPSTAMQPGFGVKNIFDMADDMGIKYKDRTEDSAIKLLENSKLNKRFGDSYLGAMERKFGKDARLAAAAYNAGPGAVLKAKGVPEYKETQKYISGLPAITPTAAAPAPAPITLAAAQAPAAAPAPAPTPATFEGSRERPWWQKLSPISSAQAAELPAQPRTEAERRAFLESQFQSSVDQNVAPAATEDWRPKYISDLTKAFGVVPDMAETLFRKMVSAPNTRDWAAPAEKEPASGLTAITDAAEQRRLAAMPSGAVISEGQPAPGAVTTDELGNQIITDPALKAKLAESQAAIERARGTELPTVPYVSGQQAITPASPEMAAIAARQRAGEQKPAEAPAGTPESDYMSELRKSLGERSAALAKQREEDKYMALLAAGLGIMGGTSPYAMTNIGAGGLKGIQSLAEARRQQREEEQDILAGRLGLAKVGAEEKYREALLKERAAGRGIQEKAMQAKMAALQQKARAEWDTSGAKSDLIKSFNKKDWMNDDVMRAKYEAARNRYINQFVIGEADLGALSADELLTRPTP